MSIRRNDGKPNLRRLLVEVARVVAEQWALRDERERLAASQAVSPPPPQPMVTPAVGIQTAVVEECKGKVTGPVPTFSKDEDAAPNGPPPPTPDGVDSFGLGHSLSGSESPEPSPIPLYSPGLQASEAREDQPAAGGPGLPADAGFSVIADTAAAEGASAGAYIEPAGAAAGGVSPCRVAARPGAAAASRAAAAPRPGAAARYFAAAAAAPYHSAAAAASGPSEEAAMPPPVPLQAAASAPSACAPPGSAPTMPRHSLSQPDLRQHPHTSRGTRLPGDLQAPNAPDPPWLAAPRAVPIRPDVRALLAVPVPLRVPASRGAHLHLDVPDPPEDPLRIELGPPPPTPQMHCWWCGLQLGRAPPPGSPESESIQAHVAECLRDRDRECERKKKGKDGCMK